MKMLNKLWGWIAAAFGLLVALLLFVIGQRDKARAKADKVSIELQAREAMQDAERATSKAREQARSKAAEQQRNADERNEETRPTGTFRR